jgi:hypothetical protein
MLGNPFDAMDNRVRAVFEAAPHNTILYKFDETIQAYRSNTKRIIGGVTSWTDELMTLFPGEGLIIQSPSAFTLKCIGRVRQNCVKKEVWAQWAMHSSIVVLDGLLDSELRFPIAHGDTIYRMTGTDGTYTMYTYNNGTWNPTEPAISLGEAFWSSKGKRAVWRQNYSAW